ncbi:MAG: phosphate ABC transporter permease PstA [Planctomycetaceae bacterium]|nr:phosphate ABC transporter permease PstA [Planctomycetaceae bacterium]
MSADSVAAPKITFTPGADNRVRRRLLWSNLVRQACRIAVYSAIVVLLVLLSVVFWLSIGWLDAQFLQSGTSRLAERAGIKAGLWGSFWLILLTAVISLPIGVGAAVYLEEYASDNRLTRTIKTNLANLAGVPSIVYGMLGLAAFVKMFGLFGGLRSGLQLNLGLLVVPLPFGKTVISGALTMSLLILPIVIIAAQESLRAVPRSIRIASLALGATRWQTVWRQVLPAALPGIATGAILAISRAIGETAPLLMAGAVSMARIYPGGIESPMDLLDPSKVGAAPFSAYTTMPTAIYEYIKIPEEEFAHVAAAGIVVLMIVLTVFNAAAVVIRMRAAKKVKW